jgi:hypothetical protein
MDPCPRRGVGLSRGPVGSTCGGVCRGRRAQVQSATRAKKFSANPSGAIMVDPEGKRARHAITADVFPL